MAFILHVHHLFDPRCYYVVRDGDTSYLSTHKDMAEEFATEDKAMTAAQLYAEARPDRPLAIAVERLPEPELPHNVAKIFADIP